MEINRHRTTILSLITVVLAATAIAAGPAPRRIPRTADGHPNLEGIWQAAGSANAGLEDHAARQNMPAGRSVIVGGQPIPYQPSALTKRNENFRDRAKADPFNRCFIPGVPRIMYVDHPFQIFQSVRAIGMNFEWSLDYRLIYTDGSQHPEDIDGWMGDSRARWERDTLIVDVANFNANTWLDMSGNFHSDALHVIERYRMEDPDTIRYEATIEDPKVLTKPFTIRIPLRRRFDRDRLFEYSCESELEEANGDFQPEPQTWYLGKDSSPISPMEVFTPLPPFVPKPVAGLQRTPWGKPDLNGFYEAQNGGANWGIEKHIGDGLTPGGRGVIIDPPDHLLPLRPWAREERVSRNLPERGYDDPTAHCFPAGVPRSIYVPQGLQITQTKEYVLIYYERMAWRIIDLKARPHLPDTIRLWQGDSIGHWEGDTLVVDSTNFNGRTWLNEAGDIVSHALHVVERYIPIGPDKLRYEATVIDPVVYTRPWTMAIDVDREKFELREAACHEEEHDLQHLKEIKMAAEAKKKAAAQQQK